jgi:general secretion pathway protein G
MMELRFISSFQRKLESHCVLPAMGKKNEIPAFAGTTNRDESGFTLIELMVVLLILGLLATVVVINVMPAQDRAMTEKARTDVALLEQAAERYRLDMFAYPPAEAGLQALVQAPAGLAHPERYPAGGYIKRLPDDPWGNPYHYASPGKHGALDIYSLGADNREGGEGQDADIGNWK